MEAWGAARGHQPPLEGAGVGGSLTSRRDHNFRVNNRKDTQTLEILRKTNF